MEAFICFISLLSDEKCRIFTIDVTFRMCNDRIMLFSFHFVRFFFGDTFHWTVTICIFGFSTTNNGELLRTHWQKIHDRCTPPCVRSD